MTWATSVPILVFLGLSVLDLGPMYATDVRQHHHLMSPRRGITNNIIYTTTSAEQLVPVTMPMPGPRKSNPHIIPPDVNFGSPNSNSLSERRKMTQHRSVAHKASNRVPPVKGHLIWCLHQTRGHEDRMDRHQTDRRWSLLFFSSALWRQEGHPTCKKLGLLVVMI